MQIRRSFLERPLPWFEHVHASVDPGDGTKFVLTYMYDYRNQLCTQLDFTATKGSINFKEPVFPTPETACRKIDGPIAGSCNIAPNSEKHNSAHLLIRSKKGIDETITYVNAGDKIETTRKSFMPSATNWEYYAPIVYPQVVRTASAGNVKGELVYISGMELSNDFKLDITRADVSYTFPMSVNNEWTGFERDVFVHDLNGDGEPEVLVVVQPPRALVWIYEYDHSQKAYTPHVFDLGESARLRISYMDKDKIPSLISTNSSIIEKFPEPKGDADDCPLHISKYQSGNLVDVTKKFPHYVEHHAASLLTKYANYPVAGVDFFLAVYAMDMNNIGKKKQALDHVRKAYIGKSVEAFLQMLDTLWGPTK